MSAVIDEKAFKRCSSYIDHAKASPNCNIVAGGSYDDSVGYFIEPTVVQTSTPNEKIFRQEMFGHSEGYSNSFSLCIDWSSLLPRPGIRQQCCSLVERNSWQLLRE